MAGGPDWRGTGGRALRRLFWLFAACCAVNTIRQERGSQYAILEQTQQGSLDITPWMDWFLGCLGRAIDGAQTTLAAVLTRARFCEGIAEVAINERQRLVRNRLLGGFEGKLRHPNTRDWPGVPRTRRCATSCLSWTMAFWSATRRAVGAPVTSLARI